MHFTGGEIIPRRVLCPWRAHLLASTLPAVARATAACFVLGDDLAKWADEKTEPTDKLTLLSGSIASGESRTCLG